MWKEVDYNEGKGWSMCKGVGRIRERGGACAKGVGRMREGGEHVQRGGVE